MASTFGMAVVFLGLVIEAVAFAAMACYPLRRALPFQTPLQLQTIGCATFVVGVVVLLAARLM